MSGYVTWSSTSCGERPDQSVNTITWLSERSGMASIGVVSSAQYPQAPTRKKTAITRKRFRIDSSINRLITPRSSAASPSARTELCASGKRRLRRKIGMWLQNSEGEERLSHDVGRHPAGCLAHRTHHGAAIERHRDGSGSDPEDQGQDAEETTHAASHRQ